ncbi:hypothetical protein CANCADRAFT_2750 [Tortispora caseinolytica NRRL Y-17796]|uniref:Enoyl-CoA hydratase n=1 Tax=Tortispora caseinolytica NRRL Y-17796 TaxID=767744 RepID=A0A1E4TGZ7_9ASCO|nr:hypothetical protein CANCADRAFT_2750 [Tortispora caseinolytica NRRL Y-17796]
MCDSLPQSKSGDYTLSEPIPHVLLLTITRQRAFNSLTGKAQHALYKLLNAVDADPHFYLTIITGEGKKAFSAGADLKEYLERTTTESDALPMPNGGFGGIANRSGKKPIIAAVNGVAYGGGMEMVTNCDLVVAASHAKFGLPEALRGVYVAGGALPRLLYTLGLQRASEMALTGKPIDAQKAYDWGIVNRIAKPDQDVVEVAIELAKELLECSPDSLIANRIGIRRGWDGLGVSGATAIGLGAEQLDIERSENTIEGLRAFKEKRGTKWGDPKL